jgi:hypothetical protein
VLLFWVAIGNKALLIGSCGGFCCLHILRGFGLKKLKEGKKTNWRGMGGRAWLEVSNKKIWMILTILQGYLLAFH